MPSPIRKCVLEMANIYSKSNKQNVLDEVCAEFGLKYIRGSGFYSDRIEYISYETPQDKKSFSIILELLTKCHIIINKGSYSSIELFSTAHRVIKSLLPELGENEQLTNKILGLVTHREDGRWYKFESSLSNPPRHAALLIRFLQKETNQLENNQIQLKTNIRLSLEKRDQFLNLLDKFNILQSAPKPDILNKTKEALSIYCEFNSRYFYDFTSSQKLEIYKIINTVEKYSRDRNLGTLILTIKQLDQTFNQAIDVLDVNLLSYYFQKLVNIFVITLLNSISSTSNNRYSDGDKIELAKICKDIFSRCYKLRDKINCETWDFYGLVLQRIDLVSSKVEPPKSVALLKDIPRYQSFADGFKKLYNHRGSENTAN